MFVDEVTVFVEAGKGGDGCTSFRREKFVEMGGPNGGNGGHGANIIFKTDPGLKTLIDLKMMKTIKGEKGVNGKGSNMTGSDAEDVIIKVPCGTTVINLDTGDIIADLVKKDEEVVVAHGGRGGMGNRAFATHDNPAPRMSELGEPGEKVKIKCELKMLADVGLVGFPSVGKSSLINALTNANAKVADYHFTTLNPNLGVVKMDDNSSFIIADLPGLIEGASDGIGLGDKFLKHAMRTKVIAHVIDMGAQEGRNPIEDYETILNEIKNYDSKLANKPSIVVANKMDLKNAYTNIANFKKKYPNLEIYPISVKDGEGLKELVFKLDMLVKTYQEKEEIEENDKKSHILYKFIDETPFEITKEDDVWVVTGKEVEKLFYMTRFNEDESVERFGRKLRGMGVDKALLDVGAKYGDEVRIVDYYFDFKE